MVEGIHPTRERQLFVDNTFYIINLDLISNRVKRRGRPRIYECFTFTILARAAKAFNRATIGRVKLLFLG